MNEFEKEALLDELELKVNQVYRILKEAGFKKDRLAMVALIAAGVGALKQDGYTAEVISELAVKLYKAGSCESVITH